MSARHYVNPEPFDPADVERLTPEQERFYTASQWQLMWWKFRRHRLAVISGWFLLLIYGSIAISEWIAPYDLHSRHPDFIHFPPQAVHLFDDGSFVGPFVYGFDFELNLENLKREYTVERSPPDATVRPRPSLQKRTVRTAAELRQEALPPLPKDRMSISY
jgi:peptide/nickel transport system permease protein